MDEREKPGEEAEEAGWQAELSRLKIADPKQVRVWRDEFRRLHVQVEGDEEHVDVRPARVFPVSGAADYISFLNGKDQEVVLLRNPEALEPESRKALKEELGRTYFVPNIVEIYRIEDAHGASRWEVETDRGYRVFDIRDREDVRVLPGGRVLLQDADSNHYEISDMNALDDRSYRLLDGEV
jgi:hypothetical protein